MLRCETAMVQCRHTGLVSQTAQILTVPLEFDPIELHFLPELVFVAPSVLAPVEAFFFLGRGAHLTLYAGYVPLMLYWQRLAVLVVRFVMRVVV